MNQLNRIKLMIAVAKANLAEKEAEARAARDAARDGATLAEAAEAAAVCTTCAGAIDVEIEVAEEVGN